MVEVRVPAGPAELDADLTIPVRPRGIVVFAHGSGSSRHSPRNRKVARALQHAGYATLLMDLLTADEEHLDQQTLEFRFDVPALATRLTAAVDWLAGQPDTAALPVVLFGASTGAAAALITAADRADRVRLVISRGGRPDLAGSSLSRVRTPTLLIVGANDEHVLELNLAAVAQMSAEVDLQVIPRATHLFTEPGTLEAVMDLVKANLDGRLPPAPVEDVDAERTDS